MGSISIVPFISWIHQGSKDILSLFELFCLGIENSFSLLLRT